MARCVHRRIVLLWDAIDKDTKQITIDDGCMCSKSVPLHVRCIAGVHRSCIQGMYSLLGRIRLLVVTTGVLRMPEHAGWPNQAPKRTQLAQVRRFRINWCCGRYPTMQE